MRGLILAAALLVTTSANAKNDEVVVETSLGKFTIRLLTDQAPVSSQNFLEYVDAGFYNGTLFHRVIPTFMIQGGGYDANMREKPVRAPIKNEAANGVSNKRGTVAMARTGVVDSATSQFFVNVVDNARLDHKSPDPAGFGYAVFGQVVEGMDVVDKIRDTKTVCPSKSPEPCTASLPPGMRDVPAQAVVILKAYRKKA